MEDQEAAAVARQLQILEDDLRYVIVESTRIREVLQEVIKRIQGAFV